MSVLEEWSFFTWRGTLKSHSLNGKLYAPTEQISMGDANKEPKENTPVRGCEPCKCLTLVCTMYITTLSGSTAPGEGKPTNVLPARLMVSLLNQEMGPSGS